MTWMVVIAKRSCTLRSSAWSSSRASGSRALSGSSSSSARGRTASARASATRWRSPPDSEPGRRGSRATTPSASATSRTADGAPGFELTPGLTSAPGLTFETTLALPSRRRLRPIPPSRRPPATSGPNEMLRATVRCGNSSARWPTRPMPRRSGGAAVTSRSPAAMRPAAAGRRPASASSSTLLPAPLGPTTARYSPSATARSMGPSANEPARTRSPATPITAVPRGGRRWRARR